MLRVLVQSALDNRCLSVESEGLIRQVLAIGSYKPEDVKALERLQDAIRSGEIAREAQDRLSSDKFALI